MQATAQPWQPFVSGTPGLEDCRRRRDRKNSAEEMVVVLHGAATVRPPLLCALALMLCAGTVSANDGTGATRRAAPHPEIGGLGGLTATPDHPPGGTVEHLPDRVKERLETLTARWRNDSRVQTATTVLGLSAAALGAAQGRQTITFAGTHVMRWGLGRQLRAVEQRSGFLIAPSVGRHHLVITARKVFE
jgi:hypothetical protein